MPKYPPAIAAQKKRKNSGKDSGFGSGSIWGRVPEKTVIDFTRSMAVMIKARIPLIKALDTSIRQEKNTRFKQILEDVRKEVKSGNGLARSFSRHSGIFDELYIHLIEVGEMAGILDEILFRLSGYMEKRYSLKQKVRMAMVYPSLVMTVAAGAMLFLLLLIVPSFAEMYSDFDAKLPGSTRFILSVSQALTDNFLYICLFMAGSVTGIHGWAQTPGGRHFIDRLKLNIPFFGSLYQKTIMSRFCQTLGTLLTSGITLVDALDIIRKSSGNVLVSEATEGMLRSVKKGGSLTKSLEHSRVFPGMVIQMVTVGEETAELDEMLLHVAALYEEEADIAVEGLTSIIEPVLIVILGILLGGIIIAMYLPMFELMNVIQ